MSYMSDVRSACLSVEAGKRLRENPPQPMRVMTPEEIRARRQVEREGLSVYNLSEAESLAILNMGENTRSQAIWHALRQEYSAPPFTLSTFVALKDKGLTHKPPERRYHVLTSAGRAIESLVADEIQQARNVHASYLGNRGNATIHLSCTCGWGCAIRSWGNVQDKASRAMSTHLRTVAAMNNLKTALVPVCQGDATG